MINLLQEIQEANESNHHGWTTIEQAVSMACAIVSTRPQVSVEIGVYAGKGIVPMAMAHRFIGSGKVIGIDPWDPVASVEGQVHDNDKTWWSALDHEDIYRTCMSEIGKYGLSGWSEIIRKRSNDVEVPGGIGLIRIDGNHGEQAFVDAQRFCPSVNPGGFLFLDDMGWSGGSVSKASEWLMSNGWIHIYNIGDTGVFQRVSK